MTGKERQKAAWQAQVLEHFEPTQLSPQARRRLRSQLMEADPSHVLWRQGLRWLHASGIGYLATAVAAAALTLTTLELRQDALDPLDEITTFASRPYPPDFDLEGDASALQEIVQELVPQEAFTAEIPKLVQDLYSPVDGRFFSWSGAAGVRINLVRSGQLNPQVGTDRDTLYIVRLTEKSVSKFPTERTTKKFQAQAGREKRVKAWREGRYGYALVQYVATNESNPALDEP